MSECFKFVSWRAKFYCRLSAKGRNWKNCEKLIFFPFFYEIWVIETEIVLYSLQFCKQKDKKKQNTKKPNFNCYMYHPIWDIAFEIKF